MIKKERQNILIIGLTLFALVLIAFLLILTINLFFLKPTPQGLLGSLRSGTLFQAFAGEQYDIAITNVQATTPTGLSKGDFVSINITLTNQGLYEDTFETLFSEYLLGTINRQTITLIPGETQTLSYNFTANFGKRTYSFFAASLNDENLTNNLFNYKTSIQATQDVKGELQITPENQGNYIQTISNLIINITNPGTNTANNINYTLFITNSDDPTKPQTISEIIPTINPGQEIIIQPTLTLETNKDYLAILILNYTEDEYLANNAHTKELFVRTSGPDIDLMLSNYQGLVENNYMFMGESKDISLTIKNKGNQPSGQITLSVYDYDPECIANEDFENSSCIKGLITQETLESIPEYSLSNYQFTYYGAQEGVYTLKAEAIPTQQDTTSRNNYEFIPVTVKQTGTDLGVYITPEQEYKEFIVNETNNLTVRIANLGNVKATNIKAELYINNCTYNQTLGYTTCKYQLISQNTLSELASKKYAPLDIPFRINNTGYASFKVNVTSDEEDVDFSTNRDYISLQILSKDYSYSIDVLETSDFYESNHIAHGTLAFPIVGKNHTLFIVINNYGRTINKVDLSFYINYTTGVETLIATNQTEKIIYNLPGYSSFTWVPGAPGTYPIRIHAVVEENDQFVEEEYLGFITIFLSRNLTINITNHTSSPVKRYVKSTLFLDRPKDVFGRASNEYYINGEKSLEIADLGIMEFQLIDYYNHNYAAAYNFSVRYTTGMEGLTGNLSITSEKYDKITDEGREFYYVFANKIQSPHNDQYVSDYSIIINNETLAKSGIDDLLGEHAIYYCTNFNFTKPGCNQEWNYMHHTYAQDINLTDIYPPEIIGYISEDYYITPMKEITSSSQTIDDVEAIAISKSEGFDGITTDLKYISVPYDGMLSNLILEKRFYGRIRFLELINVTRIRENNGLLDYYVTIQNKKIGIDTTKLPELNKKAELTFRGINMENPTVLKDGSTCPTSICSGLEYNSTTQTLTLNVNSFSEYTVVNVPLCGNDICDNSEDCSSCPTDCGECEEEDEGDSTTTTGTNSGNTGTTTVKKTTCIPNWTCTWSECDDEMQIRTCVDNNYCNTTLGKPSNKTRICLSEETCTDADGDGYGVGEACLGPDIDETDSSIWEEETPKDNTELIIYAIAIAVIIIILVITIVVILILIKNKKKYK